MRLPRMKEIRKAPKATLRGFVESSANPDDVPYADRAREKQRVRALVEQRAARESHPEAFVIVSKREKEKQRREEALVTTERTKSEKRLARLNIYNLY